MQNIQIIRTVQDADEALSRLVAQKFTNELAAIRQAAQTMSHGRAGMPGRDQALRAVLIGFVDNVETMEGAA